jgi:uncharacterized protein YegP (UPF0339 family)/uncharacterized membrane-anchored protein YhcB (DUF1043 family)
MNQLFLQLAQSVTGNVITIVALDLVAAIIGFVVAWFYARSVYTPVIKGLEADKTNLNSQVVKLKDEFGNLNEKVNKLSVKVTELEEQVSEKEKEIKNLSSKAIQIGKFAVSTSRGGGNYFNLKATNGQVILTSVMYASPADCNEAIESVREYCTDDSRYDRKISTDHKPYFNLTSPAGQVIGKSEMYESSAGMENGIESVKKNGISTIVVEE